MAVALTEPQRIALRQEIDRRRRALQEERLGPGWYDRGQKVEAALDRLAGIRRRTDATAAVLVFRARPVRRHAFSMPDTDGHPGTLAQ